jgi:hypothetical protein
MVYILRDDHLKWQTHLSPHSSNQYWRDIKIMWSQRQKHCNNTHDYSAISTGKNNPISPLHSKCQTDTFVCQELHFLLLREADANYNIIITFSILSCIRHPIH